MKTKLFLCSWVFAFALQAQSFDEYEKVLSVLGEEKSSPLMMLEEKSSFEKRNSDSVVKRTLEERRRAEMTNQGMTIQEENNQTIPRREEIENRMRKTIATTATIHVAGELLLQEQEIKKTLIQQYHDVDWNSSLDALMKNILLSKYKQELIAQLQEGLEFSTNELEKEQRVVQEYESKAKKLAVEANSMNVAIASREALLNSYQNVIEAWAETAAAYQLFLAKAEALFSSNVDSNAVITAQGNAEAQQNFWQIKEQKLLVEEQEEKFKYNAENAIALKTAWSLIVEAYEPAMKHSELFDSEKLTEEYRIALKRKTFWEKESLMAQTGEAASVNILEKPCKHQDSTAQKEAIKNAIKTIASMRGRAGRVIKALEFVDKERQKRASEVEPNAKTFNESSWAKASALRDIVESQAALTAPFIRAAAQELLKSGRVRKIRLAINSFEEALDTKKINALLVEEIKNLKTLSKEVQQQLMDTSIVAFNSEKNSQQTAVIVAEATKNVKLLRDQNKQTVTRVTNMDLLLQRSVSETQDKLQQGISTAVQSMLLAEGANKKTDEALQEARKASIQAGKAFQAIGMNQIPGATRIMGKVQNVANALLRALNYAKAGNFNDMVSSIKNAQDCQRIVDDLDYEMKAIQAAAAGSYEIAHVWNVVERSSQARNRKAKEAAIKCIEQLLQAEEAEKNNRSTNLQVAFQARELAAQYWMLAEQSLHNVCKAVTALEKVIDGLSKERAAQSRGDEKVAACWREVIKQYQLINTHYQDSIDGAFLDQSWLEHREKKAAALETIAACEEAASKARVEENQELATAWAKTTEAFKNLNRNLDQLLKAYEEYKKNEADHMMQHIILPSTAAVENQRQSTEYLIKAQHYEKSEKQELALCCREIMKRFQSLPAQNYNSDHTPFQNLQHLIKQVEYLEKAEQAFAAGNQELSRLCKGIAVNYQTQSKNSAQIRQQLVEAERSEQNCKTERERQRQDYYNYYSQQMRDNQEAEWGRVASKASELRAQCNAIDFALNNNNFYIQQEAILEKEAGYLKKAQEAQAAGDSDLANAWKEAAKSWKECESTKLEQKRNPLQFNSYSNSKDYQRQVQYNENQKTYLERAVTLSLKAAEWLTKNREVTTAENEALSQYCKKAAQQFQLALQGHQKNRNACWWSCLTYFESNSDPLVKVATIAEASAQALSQGAESLLRVHDNKKNLEASLKAATEESLDLWSTALEQLKIVFGMNTQATQALRTGNSEEARLSAGAAQEAERNFMKEVEKIQEEKIKLLLNAFGTHH